ncbi:MAG TPA: transglycosylase domain-containing protein [Jatrophihabitantaceae bacterium]
MANIPPNQDRWPTIGKLVGALFAAAILTVGLALPYVGGLGLAARHESVKFLDTGCNLEETQPPQPSTIYASDGKTVIARIFTQDRQPVPLTDVPQALQDALVATEDRRFFSHHGVDMRGLLRSLVNSANGDTQGGSTLTMQYVKQIRYYQAGKDVAKQQAAIQQNLNRKIEDAKCALYIENTKHESKDTILDNYLNIAFFGENAYGIETAARTYFNVDVQKLSLPQSALLVGLLRAPTQYDPFQFPAAAKARRNEVLQNLVSVGKLSQSAATKYEATPVRLATTSPQEVREGCSSAGQYSTPKILNVGFFCDYVSNWLSTVQGINDLDTGGYKIITTLSPSLQNTAQQNLWSNFPPSAQMTVAEPAVDPATGNVLAMVSSKLYGNTTSAKDNTHTTLANFTNYTASGASTYKLFPLLTALQMGIPATFTLGTDQGGKGYSPANCFDGGATGTQATVHNGDANESYSVNETLSSATAKSSNTFFVGLVDSVWGCDLQPVVNMAIKLGVNGLTQPVETGSKVTIGQNIVSNQYALQIALGSGLGTSPLEMAGAYAAIANGGKFNAPAPITSITDENNKAVIVKRSPATQVVSPQVAAQAVSILSGDTRFPGTSASQFANGWYSQNSSVIAGKTGTAVDGEKGLQNSGLWFVGMTPSLVATTAVINPSGPSNPISSLPNSSDPANSAYGDYAAGLWLNSFAPTLLPLHWSWPDPNSPTFGVPVPPVAGQTVAQAQATLSAAGFKMTQLDSANHTTCASAQPPGTIAYAGPEIAQKGTTIVVCPSSGVQPYVYTPPKPTATITKSNTNSGPPQPGGGGRTITVTRTHGRPTPTIPIPTITR